VHNWGWAPRGGDGDANGQRGITGFVDEAAGQVSREIFVNDAIYREELERVFARPGCLSGMRARSRTPAISSYPQWARNR